MPSYEIRIDLRLHPLSAIQKAVAAFTGRYTAQISSLGEEYVAVTLTNRTEFEPSDPTASFHDHLLQVTLQERISDQTRNIRFALVHAALSEALPNKGAS